MLVCIFTFNFLGTLFIIFKLLTLLSISQKWIGLVWLFFIKSDTVLLIAKIIFQKMENKEIEEYSDVILRSPLQHFGIDSLLSEKIFSYLNGLDYLSCMRVSPQWRQFVTRLLTSRRLGSAIYKKIDQIFHHKWFESKYKEREVFR